MVQRLLQVRAHLILCFRAEPKIEMARGADGKMEIREKQSLTGLHGWIPITEKNLPYELTASFLLMADRPGVPQPIKLQEQHRALFPLTEPITEASGARLAAWAKGLTAVTMTEWASDWVTRINAATTKAALQAVGKQLSAAKRTMPADELETLRAAYDARLKTIGAGPTPVAATDIHWQSEQHREGEIMTTPSNKPTPPPETDRPDRGGAHPDHDLPKPERPDRPGRPAEPAPEPAPKS